jgi:hypothetical protein
MKHVPTKLWADSEPIDSDSHAADKQIARLTNLVLASLGVSVFAAVMSLAAAVTGLVSMFSR